MKENYACRYPKTTVTHQAQSLALQLKLFLMFETANTLSSSAANEVLFEFDSLFVLSMLEIVEGE